MQGKGTKLGEIPNGEPILFAPAAANRPTAPT